VACLLGLFLNKINGSHRADLSPNGLTEMEVAALCNCSAWSEDVLNSSDGCLLKNTYTVVLDLQLIFIPYFLGPDFKGNVKRDRMRVKGRE
jgi:hypothetical protein